MVIEADNDTQGHLVECKSFRPLGAENNIASVTLHFGVFG
jgi:hypothetical protein